MRESSCVLYLGEKAPKLWDVQIGGPASVEFDFLKIWEESKRVNFAPSDLLFLHVHPSGYGVGYSATDMDCLQGFVKAFGTTPRFGIVAYDRVTTTVMQGRYQEYYCTHNLRVRHKYFPRDTAAAQGLLVFILANPELEPYFRMLYHLSYSPGMVVPEKEIAAD